MRTLRQPSDPGPPPIRIDVGKVGVIYEHPALGRRERPAQQRQQGTFARSARPDQRDDLAPPDGQVDLRGVAQAHSVQPQGREVGRCRPRAMTGGGNRGRVDHVESRGGRGQPGHGRVVLRPDLPQRQVDLRGEQQGEQPGTQVERTRHQSQPHRHRDQRHRQRRQQLQHERRQERPPQRRHGLFPVGIGDPADHLYLDLRPIEDLQCRQSLDNIEEMPGQPAEYRQLPVGPGTGGEPHQRHEDRDEWKCDDQYDRGRQVDTGDPNQHEQWDDHHHDQCGQKTGQVGVHAVKTGARGDRERPRIRTVTALDDCSQHGCAQVTRHRRGGPFSGPFGQPDHHRPDGHHRDEHRQCRELTGDDVLARAALLTGNSVLTGDNDVRQHRRLDDHEDRRGDRENPEPHQVPAQSGCGPQQPRINRPHRTPQASGGRPSMTTPGSRGPPE